MDDRLPDNRELLDAYRRAEPKALERIYRAYVREVAAFLRNGFSFSSGDKMLRFAGYQAPEDLQDALQETFLFALGESARIGYNGLTPYKSYLLGIAKNVVLGRFRKDLHRVCLFVPVKREAENSAGAAEEAALDRFADCAPPFPAPDEAIEKKEIRHLVDCVLKELTPLQGQIIQLYFQDEQTQEKIATELGINRNHLRKHLMVIKKKLFKRLKKAGLGQWMVEPAKPVEVKS